MRERFELADAWIGADGPTAVLRERDAIREVLHLEIEGEMVE
ncbi:MAG: hypothetical protein U5L11_04585 [Arhodomonas sp.]|nr:hypothetical protein [Arhodomonas sp.]